MRTTVLIDHDLLLHLSNDRYDLTVVDRSKPIFKISS